MGDVNLGDFFSIFYIFKVLILSSFSALKTQFLGSVRSVSNHMLLGIMQNGICLKAYTQKFIVVSQILSYSFIPRINYQS